MKSSLSTLPAGGGGTLDLTIKQLGQIDFTDLASLKAREGSTTPTRLYFSSRHAKRFSFLLTVY